MKNLRFLGTKTETAKVSLVSLTFDMQLGACVLYARLKVVGFLKMALCTHWSPIYSLESRLITALCTHWTPKYSLENRWFLHTLRTFAASICSLESRWVLIHRKAIYSLVNGSLSLLSLYVSLMNFYLGSFILTNVSIANALSFSTGFNDQPHMGLYRLRGLESHRNEMRQKTPKARVSLYYGLVSSLFTFKAFQKDQYI